MKVVSVEKYQENGEQRKPKIISVEKYKEPTQESNPKTTVGQDILQGILDVPSVAYNAAKSIPYELYGATNQLVNDPRRFLKNLGAAMIAPGKAVADLPPNVANYLASKNIISPQTAQKIPRSPLYKTNVPEWLGVKGQQSGDALLQGAGYAPFGMAGELGELGVAGRGLARAGAAGTYAAGENQNPLTAALAGPAMTGPASLAMKGVSSVNALRPSVAFSGNLSNQELQNNLRAAQGTNALLGDVLGDPKLKQTYENEIAPTWGSGSDKVYKNIENQVQKKGENLVSDIAKDSGINSSSLSENDYIKKVLLNAKNEHSKEKNKLYESLNEMAKEQGFSPDLSNFIDEANRINYDLSTSPIAKVTKGRKELAGKTSVLKESNNIVDELGNPIRNTQGQEMNKVSLPDAMNLKSDLYNKATNLLKSSSGSDKNLGYEYIKLYKTLSNDINSSLSRSSPALKNAYDVANKYYSDQFSKFIGKDLRDYFDESKSSDSIARQIIKPSRKNDKIHILSKIIDVLPKEEKGAFAQNYLNNAIDVEGNLNIQKLSSLIGELGTNQFNKLFENPQHKQQVLDFVKLKKMSEDPIRRLSNPQTGSQNKYHYIRTLLTALGAGTGAVGGGGIGAAIGATAAGIAPSVAANYITKYVSSPKVRENLVNKIIKNQSVDNYAPDYLKFLLKNAKIGSPALTVNEQKEGK